MYFQITSATQAALALNPALRPVTYQLGSGTGYTPSPTDTGIHGSQVYTSLLSPADIISGNVLRYGILLVESIGTFTFGEVGLYALDGSLFALGVLGTPITKTANEGSLQLDCYLSAVSSDYNMWLDIANTSNAFHLGVLNSADQLPTGSNTIPSAYVIRRGTADSFIAKSDGTGLWSLDNYVSSIQASAISSADLLSITVPVAGYTGPTSFDASNPVIIEFITGALYSICRVISSIVDSGSTITIGFSTVLTQAPAVGDQFTILTPSASIVAAVEAAQAATLGSVTEAAASATAASGFATAASASALAASDSAAAAATSESTTATYEAGAEASASAASDSAIAAAGSAAIALGNANSTSTIAGAVAVNAGKAAASAALAASAVATITTGRTVYTFTATAGQTSWSETGVTWTPGTVDVFVNGSRWNITESFSDSSGSSVTFNNPLLAGYEVTIVIGVAVILPVVGVSAAVLSLATSGNGANLVGFTGANGNATTVAALASPAAGNGANLISFKQSGSAYPITVNLALSTIVHVAQFGAVGTADDTATLNAALAYVRTQAAANIPVVLDIGNGTYNATSINGTGIQCPGWGIRGVGAQINGIGAGKVTLDLLGSRFGIFDGFVVSGSQTNTPTVGIQWGRNSAAVADCHVFRAVTTLGYFTLSGAINFASETNAYEHCRFWNYSSSSSAYCLIHDADNTFNAQSQYIAVTAGVGVDASFNEVLGTSIDMRKGFGLGAGPCLYIGNHSSRHKFVNSYAACASGAAIVVSCENSEGHEELDLDIHCETTGLQTCVSFLRYGSNITIRGFKFWDHAPQANAQIFLDDGTAGGLTILNAEIRIARYQFTPSNGMFNPQAKFNVTGKIFSGQGAPFNNPSFFAGTLEVDDSNLPAYGFGAYDINAPLMNGAQVNEKVIKGGLRIYGDGNQISAGQLASSQYIKALPYEVQYASTAGTTSLSFLNLGSPSRDSAVAALTAGTEVQIITGGHAALKTAAWARATGAFEIPNYGAVGTSVVGYLFNINSNLTGATTAIGVRVGATVQSDVTSGGRGFSTSLSTAAATFTTNQLLHYYANQGTIGVGSTVTNQYGFLAESTLIGGVNNFGFFGNLPAAAANWNFYAPGTAKNYMAGVLQLGSTTAFGTSEELQITGATRATTYIAAGAGLRVVEGSNAKQGVATLVSGTVVVPNTSITASSRIMLTAQDNNSVGSLRVSARTPGTSFTITSNNGTDSGVVAYEIFEPG